VFDAVELFLHLALNAGAIDSDRYLTPDCSQGSNIILGEGVRFSALNIESSQKTLSNEQRDC
jgi:hypothetical protein